jgi:hypothetical protein
MTVHFCHDSGDRTTPADGHSEVMNRVDIRRFLDAPNFREYTAHPRSQPERPTSPTRGSGDHQQTPRKLCITF